MHQVIGRQHRDLAASAWRIDHKVGNRHAAGMALEGPDDAHAGLHRGAKMVGALGQVRLVQVVGFHPSQKQLVHQAFHDLRVIVDAFEQNGLGAQRHARVRQHAAGGFYLRRQFVRVVEMQVHVNRVVLLDDLAELGGDPLRQSARDARADADDFQMRDRSQRLENALQQMVGQQQRISSRKDHVAHFCMVSQVRDGEVQLPLLEKSGFPHQALARAEPAVDRTLVGHHEQHPVRIPVYEVGHRAHHVFHQRVCLGVLVLQFGRVGDHLPPDRVALLFDGGHDRRRNAHWVLADDGLDLLGIHAQVIREVFRLHHAVRQNPSPFLHSSRSLLV